MYTATSVLTLRARGSLRRRLLDPDSSAEGNTASDFTSLLRGVSLSPRVLYGYYYLRQSALLSWNPCRGYGRLAVVGLRGRSGERRRLCCCCCDGGGGGRFEEAVGLLRGVGEGCCQEGRSGFVGKVESCWEGGGFGFGDGARGGACRNVNSFGEDECLLGRNELDLPYATFSGDLWHRDGCKGRVDVEGIAGRRRRRLEKENSSQRGSRASLQANSRKDDVESSSSGDGWKKDFTEDSTLQLRREHTREENRRLREEIRRISKMSDTNESIEENRKLREEMARLLKTSRVIENIEEENRRLREEMGRLLRTSQVKENVVEENKRLREEMERISRISDVKEDTIEENRRLLEEMNRRSREETERRSKTLEAKESIIEENRKLREDIERISKTFEMNERVRNDSSSENASAVKAENGGKMSALTANLLAEVTRQRQEINLLRENYESLLRRSQVHDTSIIRSSECNIASTSKSEDNSLLSSSLASLVEELRRQSMVIEHLSRSYHELATSAQIFKSDSQSVSSSEKVFISQLRDREKVSQSSVTLIREGRDMHGDDSSASKKASFPELSASEKSNNLSEAKFVGEVREQHTYTDQYREDIQKAGTSDLLISDSKSTSVLENILASQYRHDAGTAETSELDQSDSKLTSSSVNMSASNQEGTVASMILSTVSKLGSSSGKVSASMQEDRTASMILSPDSKLASTSGNISASRHEDKLVSTILSDMTLISDKREQHNYAEKLRTDRQKLMKISDDNISMGRSSFFGAASAFDATSLSGQQQHGYVDDQKIGSLKHTTISATEEQVTDEVLTESPSLVLGVEVFKENDKLFQEDGSSAATTSGDSSSSYISADAQLRLDEHTREEKLFPERHDIIESASRLDLSSSQYIGEFVDTLQEEMSGMINSDASSGRTGIHVSEISNEAESTSAEQGSSVSEESSLKYNKEEPSQLLVLLETERRGPSEEIWDLAGPSKDHPLKDTAQKNSSEAPADSTAVPSVLGNAIIKRSGRSLWSYIADVIRLGWRPRATSQTSTFGSAMRTSLNESTSGDAWFSGHEQDEDDQTGRKKKVTAKGSGFAKRNTSKEGSASHSSKSESKVPDLEVEALITMGISTEVDDSKEPLPDIGPSEIIKDEGMGKGALPSPQTGFLSTGTLGGFDVAVESSVMLGSKVRMKNEATGGISSANHTVDLTAGHVSSAEQMVYSTAEGISSTGQLVDLTAGGISSGMQAVDLTVGGVSSAGQTVAGGLASAMQGVCSTAVGISSSMQTVAGGLSSAMQAVGSTAGGISSSSALVDLPVSLGLELEIAGIGQVPMPNILNESMGKAPLEGGLPEIVETEVKDGDLRRRKFQRIKQIPREQFDEWDEERRFESEQRTIGEFFMREALLEAKKAAESWEVPIGAVLVQDGKVIARGGNLVEELRDSTAHAEMICIREASNYLKSWRLSETTLYVTLEPCAMCAGAILQARIDTVVWGAPNKLLGADGSWVRLFPGINESSSQASSQTIGPVHPFHPKISIRRGILESECADVMQHFFQLRRKKDNKEDEEPRQRTTISAYPSKLMAKMHNIFSMMFCL